MGIDHKSIIAVPSVTLLALRNAIRDSSLRGKQLRTALHTSGSLFGSLLLERFGRLSYGAFVTPMEETVIEPRLVIPSSAVLTTKDDFGSFGSGLALSLGSEVVGWMDFGKVRGAAALKAEVRSAHLPRASAPVDLLVVAKSVAATGCTAISLTRNAEELYRPKRTVIAALFYSEQAISEIQAEFPHTTIVISGAPDRLNTDGMLLPGVGNIDLRQENDPST